MRHFPQKHKQLPMFSEQVKPLLWQRKNVL